MKPESERHTYKLVYSMLDIFTAAVYIGLVTLAHKVSYNTPRVSHIPS